MLCGCHCLQATSLLANLDVGPLLVDVVGYLLLVALGPFQCCGLIVGQASPQNLLLVFCNDVHGHEHIQRIIHPSPDVLFIILLGRACTCSALLTKY